MPRYLRHPFALLSIIFCTVTEPAWSAPTILELFTSQSCEECPVADELLHKMSQQKTHYIIFTCPIDYWNATGWKDTLSKAFCTKRQQSYSIKGPKGGKLETPELIINGRAYLKGTRSWKISNSLSADTPKIHTIQLSLKGKDELYLKVPAINLGETSGMISLFFYGKTQTVAIKDGVNEGKNVTYPFPVQSMDILHHGWKGEMIETHLALGADRVADAAGIIVLVHTGSGIAGPVVAAGRLKL